MLKILFTLSFAINVLIDQLGVGYYLYPEKFKVFERLGIHSFQIFVIYSVCILGILFGLVEATNFENRKNLFFKGLTYGLLYFISLYLLTAVHPGWEKHEFTTSLDFTIVATTFSSFVFFGAIVPSLLPNRKNFFDQPWKRLLGGVLIYLVFHPAIFAFFKYLYIAKFGSPIDVTVPAIMSFYQPSVLVLIGIIVTFFFGALACASYVLIHALMSLGQFYFGYYVPEQNLNVILASVVVVFYFLKFDSEKLHLDFINKIKSK